MSERQSFTTRAVWSGAESAGRTPESVAAFVARLHGANINLLAICLKGAQVFWPSQLFPDAVADGYAEFDLPAALLAECRKVGIKLHAWFIDYADRPDGAAYRRHPEWAMLDANGNPTQATVLRGKPYYFAWMCPARRPGYTDQWLVPLMREFAERYEFDAIHHDYIRYPGDLAPDTYCFCDDCLEHLPEYAGFRTKEFPEEPFYHESYDRPYLESHWEQSPRVLPGNWDSLPRHMKSRFLLEGSFFQGGRNDLDYFFYRYRTDAIKEAVRLAWEAVQEARPGMEVSAAVFKDSVQSGRFIGQDWRDFAPYVQYAMPMDYRDHYPGDFETYLVLLAESIERQKVWSRDYKGLWPGIAINFLYKEEQAALGGAEPPPGYWPAEKLIRAIDCIRATGVDGMCLFSEGQITRYGMWDTVREAFA